MAQIETTDRKQVAVLWEALSTGYGIDDQGNPVTTASAPLEIYVRWEAGKGEANKQVVKAFVGREIRMGSVMWLGRLIDLPSDLTTLSNLMQVVSYNEVPDVKGRFKQRTVDLVFLGSRLPQIVS